MRPIQQPFLLEDLTVGQSACVMGPEENLKDTISTLIGELFDEEEGEFDRVPAWFIIHHVTIAQEDVVYLHKFLCIVNRLVPRIFRNVNFASRIKTLLECWIQFLRLLAANPNIDYDGMVEISQQLSNGLANVGINELAAMNKLHDYYVIINNR